MRISLRWRILFFTVLTPLALTATAIWTVNRSLTDQVLTSVSDNLERASLVFEKVFEARTSKLRLAAQIVAKDPRFYSILTIAGSSQDAHYRATVQRIARSFNDVAHADLFEVFDRRGQQLASIGPQVTAPQSRRAVLNQALAGRSTEGLLVDGNHHFQIVVMPVVSEGHVQAVLLLGASVGPPLARELQLLTHSEVTFLSNGLITGSSFAAPDERSAVMAALVRPGGFGSSTVRAAAEAGVEFRVGQRSYFTLVRPLPQSGRQHRQVYVLQRSLDDATAFLRDAQAGLIRLGAMAAGAALLVGFLIAERITRPVKRLVRGAEEMERGNYDYPLGRPGHDEIGYLTERFAEMRQHEREFVRRLREAARAKSEFIALASHELRTPISVIKGYHELFAGGDLGAMSPRQQKALEAIKKSLQDLERLAENATRMSQIEEGPPTITVASHDLAEILERGATMAASEARGRRVDVNLDVDPQLGPLTLDGPRITEVVTSLVRNGIQFTPDGGHVNVLARKMDAEVVIEVEDNGIGISEDRQANLFDRPFIARTSIHHQSSGNLAFNSSGLGLGLTIARAVVEAHGGKLEVRSRPGEGSTFTIRLPLESKDLRAAA